MSRPLEYFFPATAAEDRIAEMRFGDIRVSFRRSLDGTGSMYAPCVVDFFRNRVDVTGGRPFRRAYEWCSGPGFIGFALLAAGICEELCLADVNPRAVECIERTIRRNRLRDRVTLYLGDNLGALPPHERFDLVVSNPPWFYAINPAHPLHAIVGRDLRPNDPGWRIHASFFAGIARHLEPGALVCLSELQVHNATVVLDGFDGVPYDVRPRPAIDDWKEMMEAGGLSYVDTMTFPTWFGFDGEMVVAANAAPGAYSIVDLGWNRRMLVRGVSLGERTTEDPE